MLTLKENGERLLIIHTFVSKLTSYNSTASSKTCMKLIKKEMNKRKKERERKTDLGINGFRLAPCEGILFCSPAVL